jgi:hypothetical protein
VDLLLVEVHLLGLRIEVELESLALLLGFLEASVEGDFVFVANPVEVVILIPDTPHLLLLIR